MALDHTDLTDFVIRHAVSAAMAVIEEADPSQLSKRDSLRVLDPLENPLERHREVRSTRRLPGLRLRGEALNLRWRVGAIENEARPGVTGQWI